MELEVVRGPFMLYETVDMLYKFVNGLSFRTLLNQRASANGDTAEWSVRYAEQLQQIMDDSCAELNPNQPELWHYFGRTDIGDRQEDTCLARFMISSFISLKEADFLKNVEEVRSFWRHLQKNGAWISSCSTAGLSFSYGEGSPGDLLDQICALELPPEFQLSLYRALRDFERSLDELVALIHPIAQRLEKAMAKADWILDERTTYWRNSAVDPLAFLVRFIGEEAVSRAWERTTLAVSLMNFDFIVGDAEKMPQGYLDRNYLYFGCLVNAQSAPRDRSATFASLSATLKALTDKKRLELLNRLSKESSYCQELAESMGMNPSNVSRNLTTLYNFGFLRQEREAQKYYYRTNPEAVRSFLHHLEKMLLD